MAVKTLTERVTKSTVILFVGQIATLGLNMLTVVVLARAWGEESFGIFSYGLVIVGLFALPADFGIKPVLVRELSRQRERAAEILASVLGLKIGLTIFSMLLVNGLSFFLFSDVQIRTAVLILSFSIPLTTKVSTLRIVFESVFLADLDMKVPVAFQLLDALLQLTLVLILLRLGAAENWIILAYCAALLPGFIGCVIMAGRRVRFRLAFEKERVIWFLKESIPLFIYIGLAMLYERLDVLLLKVFYDEARVGVYSSAFRLTAPLVFLPYVVTQSLYPAMSRIIDGEEERRGLIFSMGLKVLFVLGLALGLFGLIAGKPMYKLIYGIGFIEGLPAFQWLLWGQAFNFLTFFIVDYNSSQNMQRRNAQFVGIMLVMALVVDTVMIVKYGVLGAGAAKWMLQIIGAVLLVMLSKRHMDAIQVRTFIRVFFFLFILMISAMCLHYFNLVGVIKTALMVMMFVVGALKIFSSAQKKILVRGLKAITSPGS